MGMIIGALLSLQKATPRAEQRPLSTTIIQYAARMATAFRRVVFAQAWISAITTLFTWAYLDLLLPLFGVHLPLSKTLVAITFIPGLLPILGNLLSTPSLILVSFNKGLPLAGLGRAWRRGKEWKY